MLDFLLIPIAILYLMVVGLLFIYRRLEFDRTPKFGYVKKAQDWRHRRYQLRLPPIVYYELGFACTNIVTFLFMIYVNNWIIAVYAALFSAGLLFTSLFTIVHTINIYHLRSSSPAVVIAGD